MASNSANAVPIYPNAGVFSFGQTIATANTAKDGTGTVVTVLTATTDGTRVDGVLFRSIGTNVATVARIFLNNGSATTTASNNTLIGEIALPATTLSETAEQPVYLWVPPIPNLLLANTQRLTVTIGTTVAAGYAVTGLGKSY